MTVIALTDHDTLAGVGAATAAGERLGVRVIPSCEFSVAAPWGEMHLLGYFLPPDDPGLEAFLARQREHRATRARQIVERLNRLGVRLSVEDVRRESAGSALGRPHVARALVATGGARDVQSAFDRWLGRHRPAYVPKRLSSVREVTALIRAVGGVASGAHLGARATERHLETLQQDGMEAVEVLHPSHREDTAARIEAAARRLGLAPTGGSDWHGASEGRSRVALGSIRVPSAWLEALERMHRARAEAGGAS